MTDTIHLDEMPDGPPVWPKVRGDGAGGFLVADMRKGSIAHFSEEGDLLRWKDTKVKGLDIPDPAALLDLTNGNLVVVGRSGGGLLLDSSFALRRRLTFPVQAAEDAVALTDSTLVIAGIGTDVEDPVLHVWDLRSDSIIRSYFRPGMIVSPGVAAVGRWVAVEAVSTDTLVAVFPALDTAYYFHTSGRVVKRFRLPFRDLRLPIRIPDEVRDDARARRKWLTQLDLIRDIMFDSQHRMLIPYQSFNLGGEPISHLLVASSTGTGLMDLRGLPPVLYWDSERESLYLDLGSGVWLRGEFLWEKLR